MHRMHRLILLLSVTALAVTQPVGAQFEVSPDHFDNVRPARTAQFARAEQNLKERIADEQALLAQYKEQVAAREQRVESLRQEAISAGIAGDGGELFIAAFQSEQQELQALQASLSPLVDFSRDVLAGLHNDLDILEAGSAVRPHRSSKTLEASARPGR